MRGKLSSVLVLYCSRTVPACLHDLHALTALPARTSCMLCQAPWKLVCVRWEHACLAAQTGLLVFSLCSRPTENYDIRGSAGAHLNRKVRFRGIGQLTALEPPLPVGEVRSHMTRGSVRAHFSWEVRSRVVEHMTMCR
jgi:hypothetical protein